MLIIESKGKSDGPSPLNLGSSSGADSKKSSLSFSELLKGVDANKDAKGVQNGALVLKLAQDAQQNSKTATEATKAKETLLSLLKNDAIELHPSVGENLGTQEIKQLILDARNYLKAQILNSDAYIKSEIKELPKTLKGLAQIAQKLGLDMSKITLQDVTSKEMQALENTQKDTKGLANQTNALLQNKEIKELPLFKVATVTAATTEQFVQMRQVRTNDKEPREKHQETLSLLLRGGREQEVNPKLTADFSVATARVIAPSALMQDTTNSQSKNLESLLRDGSESNTNASTALKADSFEVKLSEAKQMIKYLSSDVKQAIEDYKSPFTRVKIQLNPQRLGEIDLTIVQRGKNLHVNMSSNNAAINTLVANVGELRAQLNNSGINNATLNFNNPSESGNTPGDQGARDQHRDQQRAHQEYEYFAQDESNEEIQSSLEIVVPRYI